MFYRAILTTHLVSHLAEADTDEIRNETRTTVSLRDDNSWFIRYPDADNHGHTTLQGTEKWMSVSRKGDVNVHLLFRTGESSESIYHTSQGDFQISAHTLLCNIHADEQGGNVELHYQLFLNGSAVALNELTVNWQRMAE